MAINVSDNTPRINYTATSGQTVFTVPFEFFEETDLTVYINGTAKTLTTDYTVTGGDGSTGTITLVTGATVSDKVAIVRDISIQRTTDFSAGQDINRDALNEQLDTLTALVADIDDRASRSLQLNDYEVAASVVLPDADTRKGKVLGFNETTGAAQEGPEIADVETLAAVTADIATLADTEDGTVSTNALSNLAPISADITTVAGIHANVTTVAGISLDVTSVAAVDTDVTTVASISASVPTVANISADVTTVAGVSADVTATAAIASDVSTVAGDSADIQLLADNIATIGQKATVDEAISFSIALG